MHPVYHAPQKWEYLVLQVVAVRMFGNAGIDIASDDKELQKALKQHKTLDSALSYVGSLGWELTTTTPGSAGGSHYLYFKRPAPVQQKQQQPR